MHKRLAHTVLLTIVALALAGCLGPKPVVTDQKSFPPQAGSDQPFRVEAVIENQGPGDGEVEVEVELQNKQDNTVILQDSKNVEMKVDEKQHVVFELNLPPSAKDMDPNNIEVQVEAHYPH